MGKARKSKKASKQTRKENQLPYNGNSSRRSSVQGSAAHSSQSQDIDHSTVNADNSMDAPQRLFGRDLSSSIILCQEMGVSFLPANDEVDGSIADEAVSGSKSKPTNQYVTPAVEKQDQIVHVPQAPRVLATSQRQNYNVHGSAAIFFDALTPPRQPDMQNQHYPAGPDYFENLSDEVVLHIFHYLLRYTLAKCALVCKRWNRLVNDESLWRRVDLSGRVIESRQLAHLVNRGTMFLRMAKTEVIDLSMAVISTDLLAELFGICHNLRRLSLENVELNENIFHLETLNLAWTWMPRPTIIYLSLCMPSSVRKLNISGCRENITDEDVYKLCQSCPNLVELDLSDATAITGESVVHIEKNLRYLEHLALSRCYQVTPNIISILASLPCLLALDVFGMLAEMPLQHLCSQLPRVQINKFPFSSVARPTTGNRRTSIWGERVRENVA
ncbi:hypothetical protein BaRGS_00000480 [Batillaria attramentaria]|uniref:F-box domain-containing protein n=1 Tax=Batillaria attramentaria TaxID=370345 RepID=A0ABD0M9Y2_9CAEN